MYQGRFFLIIVTAIVPFLIIVVVVRQGMIPLMSCFRIASGCGGSLSLSLTSSLLYLFVSFASTAQGKVHGLGLSWSLMFGMHVPPGGCGTRDMIQDQDMASSGEGRKDEHPPHASQGMQMLQQETMRMIKRMRRRMPLLQWGLLKQQGSNRQ